MHIPHYTYINVIIILQPQYGYWGPFYNALTTPQTIAHFLKLNNEIKPNKTLFKTNYLISRFHSKMSIRKAVTQVDISKYKLIPSRLKTLTALLEVPSTFG